VSPPSFCLRQLLPVPSFAGAYILSTLSFCRRLIFAGAYIFVDANNFVDA
jgi:hypothetical protein